MPYWDLIDAADNVYLVPGQIDTLAPYRGGNGNGVITGGLTFADGLYGRALFIDRATTDSSASNAFVSTNKAFAFDQPFTCFIRCRSKFSGAGYNPRLLCDSFDRHRLGGGSNPLSATLKNAAGVNSTLNAAALGTAWTTIVWTSTGLSGTHRVYQGGVLTGTGSTPATLQEAGNVLIGGSSDGSASFTGHFSEAGFTSEVWSLADVIDFHNGPPPRRPTIFPSLFPSFAIAP